MPASLCLFHLYLYATLPQHIVAVRLFRFAPSVHSGCRSRVGGKRGHAEGRKPFLYFSLIMTFFVMTIPLIIFSPLKGEERWHKEHIINSDTYQIRWPLTFLSYRCHAVCMRSYHWKYWKGDVRNINPVDLCSSFPIVLMSREPYVFSVINMQL